MAGFFAQLEPVAEGEVSIFLVPSTKQIVDKGPSRLPPWRAFCVSGVQFQRFVRRLIVPDDLPQIAPVDPLVAFPAEVESVAVIGELVAMASAYDRRAEFRKLRHGARISRNGKSSGTILAQYYWMAADGSVRACVATMSGSEAQPAS